MVNANPSVSNARLSYFQAFRCQGYELQYPSWHGMDRWDEGIAPGVLRPNLVGRYKESIEFQVLPQPLQTQVWAQISYCFAQNGWSSWLRKSVDLRVRGLAQAHENAAAGVEECLGHPVGGQQRVFHCLRLTRGDPQRPDLGPSTRDAPPGWAGLAPRCGIPLALGHEYGCQVFGLDHARAIRARPVASTHGLGLEPDPGDGSCWLRGLRT